MNHEIYFVVFCIHMLSTIYKCEQSVVTLQAQSQVPGLVDRVFTVHPGSRGFNSHRWHMSEGFFRLIKLPKLYMCMQTYYQHDEEGHTAPGMCSHGSVPLSHSGYVVTRIGLHKHCDFEGFVFMCLWRLLILKIY